MPRIRRHYVAQAWAQRPSLMFGLCAITLVAALLLGGGTRGGFLSDTILELIAIPAFLAAVTALIAMPWADRQGVAVWALALCLAIAALPLLQLVPLPPWIWTRLPHRDEIAGIFALVHRDLPWLPISVSPSLTWAGVLSLLPPVAVFLGAIQLGYRERRVLSLILVALGIGSALLGLLQVAQGQSSPWRFFVVTNPTEAVGFFANRNHLAALLNLVLLFGAAWAVHVGYSVGHWRERRNIETASVVALTASFLGLVILIAAEGSSRSRAGVGLLIVALFGALMLAIMDRRRSSTSTPVKLILGSVIVAVLLVLQFALYRLLDRFDDPLENLRIQFAQSTIHAAEAYMPFGSGFGTFTAVYPSFEPPQDVLDNRYVNHAHDDVLEVWLEGGAMSLLLMAVFSGWLFMASTKAWREAPADSRAIDVLLARAATIVIPIIVVHSVFDYPLRTDAMMAVFALSCALLVEPLKFVAKQEAEPQFARAREGGLQPAPVRQISEEEKRRLARLKGLTVSDDSPELLEAPIPGLLDSPDEVTSEFTVEAEATENDPFGEVTEYLPVDLDEVAGRPERHAANASDESVQQRLFGAPQGQQHGPVHVAPLQVQDNAEAPSEQAFEPRSSAPAGSATKAGAETERVGDMAYTLAQFNRLSAVLVARSEAATTQATESASAEETAGVFGNRFADVAERRMKILHSVKLVESPGVQLESKERPAAPQRSPTAQKVLDAPAAQLLEPAQRRMQALRAVERFIQTGELETPAPEPTAAVSLDISEPASDSDNVKATAKLDRAHASSSDHVGGVIEPDLLSASAATANEEVVAAVNPSPPRAPNPAQTPLAAPEGPDAAVVTSEMSAQLLQPEPQDDAVEPTIGTEAFAEIVQPMAQSDRPASAQAAVAQEPGPAPVETARPSEGSQPQAQWSDEVEWPQQWRPDSGDNATVVPHDGEQQDSDDEPLTASEPAALENAVGTPADSAAPVRAPAGTKPAPNRSPKGAPQAQVPAAASKPRPAAPAHAATFAEAPAVPDQSRWGDDIEWPEEWRK